MASSSTRPAPSSSSSTSRWKSEPAPSSSSSTSRWKYDVFLSSWGQGTNSYFTDRLYAALTGKGSFKYDEKISRVEYISREFLKAIQESMYAVVVISPNYASYEGCLIELAEIMECVRKTGLIILPVFYDVNPRDVRNQTRTFAKAFAEHEFDPQIDVETIQLWKAALKQVGYICGWDLHERNESTVVEKITAKIFSQLNSRPPRVYYMKSIESNQLNVHVQLAGIFRKKKKKKLAGIDTSAEKTIGADSLEGLPAEKMIVVGKEGCSGIKEFNSRSNLRGILHILGWENAIDPIDAWEANLSGECNLRGCSALGGLVLEWSGKKYRIKDLEVLDTLQPQESLKELTLWNYGSIEFPTWLWRASFPDMVRLRIENCEWCPSLPPVGQLPSLKFLRIAGMASVKNIGMEFYGEGCSQPFRSLETLHFKFMMEWENWSPCEEFPSLRKLSIRTCPMLSGELPNQLPLLEEIEVTYCKRLVVSISRPPALSKITIKGCKGLVCRNNNDFRGLLRSAHLNQISRSGSHFYQIEGLIDVEDLTIYDCGELMPLWSNKEGFLQPLPCLRSLHIWCCDKLVSLVANETFLPSTLRQIRITYCCALEHLPKAMMYNNTCLEFIKIHLCHSLRYFARGQLPPTLRRLCISNCNNMRMVLVEEEEEEEGTNGCSSRSTSLLLEKLHISKCPSLTSLTSSGELAATLKHLVILSCPKLESIAKSLHRNSFLETIEVRDCENLKALPTDIHSLSDLYAILISDCPNLVPFLDGGRDQFLPPNLTNLDIDTGISSFREDTLPSNLTSLKISRLEITEILLELGLHRLTSLKELVIDGGCPYLVSFPTPEMMLPASLTSLSIRSFPKLQNLSSEGLRKLASLEKLCIRLCEELTSFPEDGLPPSLLELRIRKCGKLTTFPKNGLPPSLLQLRITGCPLLEENWKKDQGREWSKIANIPYVRFVGEFAYDPEEYNREIAPHVFSTFTFSLDATPNAKK